jgi:hypothetical protein
MGSILSVLSYDIVVVVSEVIQVDDPVWSFWDWGCRVGDEEWCADIMWDDGADVDVLEL